MTMGHPRSRPQTGRVARRSQRLAEEKRQLAEEIAHLRQPARPAPSSQPAAATNAPPASVPEAVDQAQTLPGLRFLPNATDTANSPYTRQFDRHAATFHRAFQALSQCAAARAQGPLGMPTADWLKQRGVEYPPNESEKTMRCGRLANRPHRRAPAHRLRPPLTRNQKKQPPQTLAPRPNLCYITNQRGCSSLGRALQWH